MVDINVRVDTSSVDRELDRLLRGFSGFDSLRFEKILTAQFLATQRTVHIITGSLKGSGIQHSRSLRERWSGEISYGGATTGPINPVDYAVYEMERSLVGYGSEVEGRTFSGVWNRQHNFMQPITGSFELWPWVAKDEYYEAIKDFLGGAV